ncbi:hypothetical protein EAT49_00800 [Histidinibacterium lentulum]|uniref:DUF1795 domain-containing protein n=2 Tax=Histidinibacterium lentulum TaxID=2480588 RepID=A0A3N2R922_9RHOB|nr:hypothetical protein EAT49_00800 [Histidinibacterium lentulum]
MLPVLALGLAIGPAAAFAQEGCTELGADLAFCPGGTGWEGVPLETAEIGLTLTSGDVTLSIQAVEVPEDPSAEELRLTVTDMAERLIGDDLSAFRPILEDRPETGAGLALRVAFVSGSFDEPLVFALTIVSTGGGVALIQTRAEAEYLDETHSALHRDAISALGVRP